MTQQLETNSCVTYYHLYFTHFDLITPVMMIVFAVKRLSLLFFFFFFTPTNQQRATYPPDSTKSAAEVAWGHLTLFLFFFFNCQRNSWFFQSVFIMTLGKNLMRNNYFPTNMPVTKTRLPGGFCWKQQWFCWNNKCESKIMISNLREYMLGKIRQNKSYKVAV